MLNLGEFEGKEHVGLDDTHNVARILSELARRAVQAHEQQTATNCNQRGGSTLVPNINTRHTHQRRWFWMSSRDHEVGKVMWKREAERSEDEGDAQHSTRDSVHK